MKEQAPDNFTQNILYQQSMEEWWPVLDASRELRRIEKGKTIFKEGDDLKGVYFIGKGKVKIHQQWDTQKEVIIRFARNGDMIGYRGIGSRKKVTVSATALETSWLIYIPLLLFEKSLRVNFGLTHTLMGLYVSELEATERRVRNMAHMDVRGRIAEALLMLKTYFGLDHRGFIDLRLTKQEIASYVGTTYETISRVAAEFESKKWIKMEGRSIAVLRIKALQGLCIQ